MKIYPYVRSLVALGMTVSILMLVGYGALRAPEYRPTCVSFKIVGDTSKVVSVLTNFISSGKMVWKKPGDLSVRAHNDDYFLKWDQISSDGAGVIFLCGQGSREDVWRQAVKSLEHGLEGVVNINEIILQRGDDYSCDRGCEFHDCKSACSQVLPMPIDFDGLRSLGILR